MTKKESKISVSDIMKAPLRRYRVKYKNMSWYSPEVYHENDTFKDMTVVAYDIDEAMTVFLSHAKRVTETQMTHVSFEDLYMDPIGWDE
jgi:hypothetical protein